METAVAYNPSEFNEFDFDGFIDNDIETDLYDESIDLDNIDGEDCDWFDDLM